MFGGRVRRERLIRAGSLVILLFAILPSVTFVGHGPIAVGPSQSQNHVHSGVPQGGDDEGDHASHCHKGLSKCGGGSQSLVGTWWVGDDAGVPDPDDDLLRIIPSSDRSLHTSDIYSKILRPPKT